ncbi:MAG: hypothetical protein A3A94_03260 [Candidatus Portnoybacteria bacterium RIFCSPLOWO2_01_FULL_43_11]|uniref:Oxidoreductase FAD/NAD(P)-binding domain-containing protein n=3 Tax=Bacteria candidate phyla TaxID=1783234 RepID=A0A1G2FHL6_9BACT|nr:MAG: hypothetical protein A2713_02305 [candidate division WWE3 bacterium RIFCSPHIGHO2_01_FULL_35_17]OGZ37555.1 MAG: hypothetical protein A3E90_00270 [Candidatus Portnoybacteria bacterium RIFCSPHIGHO2_12_FULL_40_11]OGZ38910.1 MAG: hypothetical protein A3A94_03260 [Candidatus Portnoybacteria bacterium RIFCSPLOWO2_01_FULL_43_11]
MIRFAAEEKLAHPIILLYSNRDEQSAPYLKELKLIEEKNPYFQLKNKFGRVDAEFIKEVVKDLNEPLWYVTGPEPMVVAIKDLLFHLGINQGKIYSEEFLGY